MYRLAAAVLMSAALLAPAASAQDTTAASYFSGRTYMQNSEDQRNVYVAGLMDMLQEAAYFATDQGKTALIERAQRCLKDRTTSQLREFVDAYVNSDPAYLNYSMASNFSAAILTRCPR